MRLDGKLGVQGRKSEALIEIEGVYTHSVTDSSARRLTR